MAIATVSDGIAIHYELEGDPSHPVLVLSNSLGTHLGMWEGQVASFSDRYRVLRYDTRGHGQSDAPEGPYSLSRLGQDVVDLLDALGVRQAHFCGLSLGGMTGMWLGINAADRFRSLTLCCTSAYLPPAELWDNRIELVAASGMEPIAESVLQRWFTPCFLDSNSSMIDLVREQLVLTQPKGYIGCCAAIRNMDQRTCLKKIELPSLVVAAADDLATPSEYGKFITREIINCEYVELSDAAHLSNIEQRDAFNAALTKFLDRH